MNAAADILVPAEENYNVVDEYKKALKEALEKYWSNVSTIVRRIVNESTKEEVKKGSAMIVRKGEEENGYVYLATVNYGAIEIIRE